MIGIVFGSTTGNTETVAERIQSAIGSDKSELINISDSNPEVLGQFEMLILGASTWGLGDLQDDWESPLKTMSNMSFSGKKIALFGCGDQEAYGDTFVDAIGIIYEELKGTGAQFLGRTSTEGYTFDESKAVIDGQFIGLVIDEDCQSNQSEDRIVQWVSNLEI